ncbi:tail fiber domain-containing protein [Azospirillum baldaniorum]|uniref:tail fiber domain-containing protein n=1 Tax=Azospirillum baldaniorum TaxID=1064539 RepID=UPI001FFE71EB|nr:tail fiber domain-containing protein [Azospirillum baldaniorum]
MLSRRSVLKRHAALMAAALPLLSGDRRMSLLPTPRQFAVDANGAPLAGAKLFFFEAGTSSPKTVYADSALATAHTLPVVADGAGLWPAIYLGPGDYKIEQRNADGVTVWTQDSVTGTSSTQGRVAENIGAMKALSTGQAAAYTSIQVLGYAAPGDGGAGWFTWDAGSTKAEVPGLVVKPTGSVSAGRWLRVLTGGVLDVRAIGCKADGVTDDSVALAAFFAAVTGMGVITVPDDARLYLGSSVTVRAGWTLEGRGGGQGVTDNATQSYYDRGAQVKLGPGATLRHGGNGEVVDLLVIRSGLTQPVPNVATATALVSQFSGVGIECAGEDVTVRNCLILGHAVGIDSKGKARTKVLDCGVDCQAGVLISGGYDICRLERVHVWPFMTATTPGVHAGSDSSHAPLRRTGVGIEFSSDNVGGADWSTAIDCFSYGHAINYSQRNVSNVSFVRCQADYGAPNTGSLRGYSITGTTTYAALINCTAIAQTTCVYVETTGGTLQDNGVRILGGIWAASSTNIFIANGAAIVQGNQFYSGSVGVLFGSGAEPGSIIGNYFQNVGDPIVIDGLVIGKTEILGNSYDGVTEAEPNRLNTPLRVARVIDLVDASAPANQKFARWNNSNNELTLELVTDNYATATPVYRVIKSGSSATTHQFYIGVTNQLEIGATNIRPNAHILPYGTGIFNLGGPSNLWLQLFAYSPTINTSDEAQKQDIAPIDDALLDAWADVSWRVYRMKDAVAEKGDAARTHAGAIAQEVHAALQAKGVDGFRYGLLCRDEVFEEVFEDRETENGPRKVLVERRPLGLRWGLRYTECLVVEAAYQRRRCDRLEARLSAAGL